jgi:hypothetical protein
MHAGYRSSDRSGTRTGASLSVENGDIRKRAFARGAPHLAYAHKRHWQEQSAEGLATAMRDLRSSGYRPNADCRIHEPPVG